MGDQFWIDFMCCTPWKSITPSTSTTDVVCGLSFSQSQPDFEGFLQAVRFPPSSKSTPSLIHLAVVLCSEVMHWLCSGAERLAGCTAPSIRPRWAASFAIQSARKGDWQVRYYYKPRSSSRSPYWNSNRASDCTVWTQLVLTAFKIVHQHVTSLDYLIHEFGQGFPLIISKFIISVVW